MSESNGGGMGEGLEGLPPELAGAVRQEMERRTRLAEAIGHFYTGDYVAMHTVELETVKIGWQGGNDLMPMVLLSKARRTELGVEVGDVVKVSVGTVSLPCLVDRQFKGMYEGISLNRLAGHVLGTVAKTSPNVDEDGQSVGVAVTRGTVVKVSSLL